MVKSAMEKSAMPKEGETLYRLRAGDERARLDKFLALALPDISRNRLKGLIESGQVRIGGETIAEPAYRVKPGAEIELSVPPPTTEAAPAPQEMALDIHYEDDDLIVVDKPAGLVVHPAAGNPDRTLVNALVAHCGASLSGIGGVRRPGIVHRLDKDTSGLLVAAKHDAAHAGLSRLFEAHDLERAYLALVWGAPAPAQKMTDQLFSADGVFGPDLLARTQHPGSHFIYERRGGQMPRLAPKPVVHEVAHGNRFEADGWRMEVAEVVHVQPQLTCLAYRVETVEGMTIVFGGDSAPTDRLTSLARGADVLLHMCHFINGAIDDDRLTSCCSGHLDAATTARDAGVKTLVLVHLTEMMETPGIRERVLADVAGVFEGQVIFAEDLLDVPLGQIETQPIR